MDDVPPDHGVAGYPQRKSIAGWLESQRLDVHRDATIGLLFAVLGIAGRDGSEEGDMHDRILQGPQGNITSRLRLLPSERFSSPFRRNACTCSCSALTLAIPRFWPISRNVGGGSPADRWLSIIRSTACWRLVGSRFIGEHLFTYN